MFDPARSLPAWLMDRPDSKFADAVLRSVVKSEAPTSTCCAPLAIAQMMS
jgi:hypothetical protein